MEDRVAQFYVVRHIDALDYARVLHQALQVVHFLIALSAVHERREALAVLK